MAIFGAEEERAFGAGIGYLLDSMNNDSGQT
jgi:hypothetical protein